jgi:hypothetical protein
VMGGDWEGKKERLSDDAGSDLGGDEIRGTGGAGVSGRTCCQHL